MATDSTELTFVRCPSCRSLVPAVSTRCRMCGAGLDASGETEGADSDQKKSGRVRQRTMSQPQSELNSAVAKLRSSEAVSAAPPPPGEPAPAAVVHAAPPPPAPEVKEEPSDEPILNVDEDLSDPLSAYIEEVEEPEAPKAKPAAPVAEKSANELNGNHSASEAVVPSANIISQRPAPAPEKPVVAAAEPREEPSKVAVEEAAPEPPQRVIVESGMRRHGKSSGLSFGNRPREDAAPKQEEPRRAEPVKQAAPEPVREVPREVPPVRQPQRIEERVERPERAEVAPPQDRRQEERRSQPVQPQRQREQERREPEREERRERPERPERQASPQQRASEGLRKSEAVSGRLFGWLVSYTDPDGAATELREGKFFVTASSLKDSDLIIDEPSISTPHALVSVSIDGGLQVQDLMSDRGVFVRRRGDDTYRREADVTRVEHGDWLRFGDVEYLVSLIAHVGVK